MAYTSNSPAEASYNNVVSLGVSYTWENGLNPTDGAATVCPGINGLRPAQYIKRTQEIEIEALNLDLENAGGTNIANLSAAQNAYANTNPVSVYANGKFVGKGRLSNYSMSEGSLTNSSITNLGYSVEDGGPDKKDPNSSDDNDENPVSRTEKITVSRDIKGKSYKITHDYTISFGTNFDAVTDFPLYSGNNTYETVDGRLALGQNEANSAIFDNVTDYGDYIDLSAYTMGAGFNFALINDNCSGVFFTSNATSDYINGNYSLSKTTELKYTGSNADPEPSSHEIDYTMTWGEVAADGYRCAKVTMKGSVKGKASSADCAAGSSAEDAAQAGYDTFVLGGTAQTRLTSFFNTIKGTVELMGIYPASLNAGIVNLKETKCVSSVSKEADGNNGTIGFEFEMDNCPNRGTPEVGNPYTWTETSNQSYSWKKDCNDVERKVTSSAVNGNVVGICGQAIDGAGTYVKWNNVSSTYYAKKAAGKATARADYDGPNYHDLKLISSSESTNQYAANGSYSWTYSDAPEKCEKTSAYDKCKTVVATENSSPAKPIKIKTVTTQGIITQEKGATLPTNQVSLKMGSNISTDADVVCAQDLDGFLAATMDELNSRKPACIINSLSWTYTKTFNTTATLDSNMGGIDL